MKNDHDSKRRAYKIFTTNLILNIKYHNYSNIIYRLACVYILFPEFIILLHLNTRTDKLFLNTA